MEQLGKGFIIIGYILAALGGLIFVGIFGIVLIHGSWPDFLWPIRSRFQIVGAFFGSFTFIVELAIFLGPGGILVLLGQKLAERRP